MHKYGGHTVVNREALSEIARNVVRDIGYDQDGFSFHGADVEVLLHGQSPDIAMGVDAKKKGGNLGEQEGAGDQGLMFGFACRDSEAYERAVHAGADLLLAPDPARAEPGAPPASCPTCSPMPRARSPCATPAARRWARPRSWFRPSTARRTGKAKVQLRHDQGDDPRARDQVAARGLDAQKDADFFVNPTGNFVVGGPDGDCGLTGRKIIVDTYGGYAPHGGGAFSGRTRPRSTARPPAPRAISPRTWSPQGWPIAA